MKRINHGGHRGKPARASRVSPRSLFLRVLCGKGSCLSVVAVLLLSSAAAHAQTRQPLPPEKHPRYQIKLALDFDGRTYTGTERVRFVNRGEHPTSSLYFHLYANVRVPGYVPPAAPAKAEPGQLTSDEPRLEITDVRSASDGSVLMYDLDDLETTLRVSLREPVAPNAATEIEIKFKGSVPEIDP